MSAADWSAAALPRRSEQPAFVDADLVAVVSHELRTPLTSIRGALQLAIQDLAGRDQRLLDVALKNCDRMVGLVNDLLDLSKIEAGQYRLARRPVAVRELISAAIDGLVPLARVASVSLTCELPPDLPRVFVDPGRMVQVLVNLLSNAIKVAPSGSEVSVRARVADQGFIEVSVTDRGRGIPARQLSRLFRKFEQLDRQSRREGGTGLGLAISKAIVEHHRGTIGVASQVGVGTTFTVMMPVARAPHNAELRRTTSAITLS
jgi:signal transduction histidine kinase